MCRTIYVNICTIKVPKRTYLKCTMASCAKHSPESTEIVKQKGERANHN